MGILSSIKGFGSKLSGAVSPYLSVASGFSSLFGKNKNIDKQIRMQQEENQKNRDWNLMLAKQQNAWNQEQWERENEYNSPVNQMKRFKDAGLNPDLVYGQGSNGNAAQLSGSLSGGAPSSPVDVSALGQKMTVGQAINQSLEFEMKRAQIEQVRKNTEGQGYTNEILRSDAAFRDALNQNELDLGSVRITLTGEEVNFKRTQIKELRANTAQIEQKTKNLKEEYNEIRARISNLDAKTAREKILTALEGPKAQAYIKQLAASTHLSYSQARSVTEKLSLEMAGLQSDIDLKAANLQGLEIANDRLQFELDMEKGYQEVERTTNVVTDICDTLLPVAQLIGTAFGGQYEEHYHKTKVNADGDVSEEYGSKSRKRRKK